MKYGYAAVAFLFLTIHAFVTGESEIRISTMIFCSNMYLLAGFVIQDIERIAKWLKQ